MGGAVICTHKEFLLHIIKAYINAGYPEEIPFCIQDRGNNTDHHDIFSHEFINIRVHDIRLASFFDLPPILFIVIVKGVFMLFKNIPGICLIGIYYGFKGHVLFVDAVGLPVGVCNDVLLKISKCSGETVPAF